MPALCRLLACAAVVSISFCISLPSSLFSCQLSAARWVSHTASSRARPGWAGWCTERRARRLPSHRSTRKLHIISTPSHPVWFLQSHICLVAMQHIELMAMAKHNVGKLWIWALLNQLCSLTSEDKGALAKLVEAIKTNYNERFEEVNTESALEYIHSCNYTHCSKHGTKFTIAIINIFPSPQIRRHWGGGIMGPKSTARINKMEKAKAKELATKLG